jgi:hypothetical protein
MADYTYRTDQSGPPIGFRWLDYNKQLYNFTVGVWVFGLQLVTFDGVQQKALDGTNIGGSAGTITGPNVIVSWPVGFFSDVPVDTYLIHLSATDEDTKPYFFSLQRLPTVQVIPAPTVV